jgi:hypothetical protein
MIFSKSTKKRLKIFSLIAIAASVIFFFYLQQFTKECGVFLRTSRNKEFKKYTF